MKTLLYSYFHLNSFTNLKWRLSNIMNYKFLFFRYFIETPVNYNIDEVSDFNICPLIRLLFLFNFPMDNRICGTQFHLPDLSVTIHAMAQFSMTGIKLPFPVSLKLGPTLGALQPYQCSDLAEAFAEDEDAFSPSGASSSTLTASTPTLTPHATPSTTA